MSCPNLVGSTEPIRTEEGYEHWECLAKAEMDGKAKPPGSLGALEAWGIR
jgi:hypothetical protein